MLATSLFIFNVATGPGAGEYQFDGYLNPSGNASQVRVGDRVTDSVGNLYDVAGWVNGGNNETNSLYTDGWRLVVTAAEGSPDVQPVEDSDYNSTIESPVVPQVGPEVSWQSIPSAVTPSTPAYTYEADLSIEIPGDPGAGTAVVGDMFVDNLGSLYEIVEWSGDTASPRHAKLRELGELGNAPNPGGVGYVYRTLDGAPVMAQARFQWLNPSARDTVNNYEKSVIWQHRGIQIGDVQVTKLAAGSGVAPVGDDQTAGWNGGFLGTLNKSPLLAVSGEALGAFEAVIIAGDTKVYRGDRADLSHAGRLVGVTLASVAGADEEAQIATDGTVTNPAWTWTPDTRLFLGTTGGITDVVPTSGGFLQPIGKALSADTIILELGAPVLL
jgi:hypothetical protein